MLHYVLPESANQSIPQLAARPDRDYFEKLTDEFVRRDITPFRTVRLRDAVFCCEKRIPLLAPEANHSALIKRKDYQAAMVGYGQTPELQAVLPPFKTCMAVSTPRGTLLFSDSPAGSARFRDFRMCLLYHYFDEPFIDKASLFRLPLFDRSLKGYIDCFPNLGRDNAFDKALDDVLSPRCCAPADACKNGLYVKSIDLSPTLNAFDALYTECKNEDYKLNICGRSRDIAGLLDIRDNGLCPFFSGSPLGAFGYEENFEQLNRSFFGAAAITDADSDALQREARSLATMLLERDFPDRRRPVTQIQQAIPPTVRHVSSMPSVRRELGKSHI